MAVDAPPWLDWLDAELQTSLAHLAITTSAVRQGLYSKLTDGVSCSPFYFNIQQTLDSEQIIQRAAERCFLSSVTSFIGFLDKCIALDQATREEIPVARGSSYEEIAADAEAYLARKISEISSNKKLTNPSKIAAFRRLPDDLKRVAFGYFALRSCLEHHQRVVQDGITLYLFRHQFLVDGAEVKATPFTIQKGQEFGVDFVWDKRCLSKGTLVSLTPKDATEINFAIRLILAPAIIKSLQPPSPQHDSGAKSPLSRAESSATVYAMVLNYGRRAE